MRPRSTSLTGQELEIMKIVWERESATVRDVYEVLLAKRKVAYTTVMTMMKILERKGYVRHRAVGRAFVYESIVDRDAAARTALSQVVQRFFGGSPQALAVNLIEGDHLTEDELDELQRTIARAGGLAFAAEPDLDIGDDAGPGQKPRLLEHHPRYAGIVDWSRRIGKGERSRARLFQLQQQAQ